jgi:D-ribose pyranase
MKKQGILNSDIARVLAAMGHTDTLCVADCGLPIPQTVERIDISLKHGFPGFMDSLALIGADMVVEHITLAEEIKENNPGILKNVEALFPGVGITFVAHGNFKELTKNCHAIVRTGEATPYANIILHSGVNF